MELKLTRTTWGPLDGVSASVGELLVPGRKEPFATLEPPWVPHSVYRAGTPFISCIPAGVYGLQRFDSDKFGPTFAFENADLGVFSHYDEREQEGDRWACLAHPATWPRNVQGCCGVGYGWRVAVDWKTGKASPMLEETGPAFQEFLSLLEPHDIIRVVITDGAR